MASQTFRVGGGYTAFTFNGTPLLYVDEVSEQAPAPVASPEEIQPLDSRHPIEIAFPIAHKAGKLTLTIREQWASSVWENLPGFEGAVDIIDVFQKNISLGSITCSKIIRLPNGGTRQIEYHNCVITEIDDSETVRVGTMTFAKRVSIMYTHKTKR